MAATQFGVIYSTQNVTIRRYVYPLSNSQLTSTLCGPGEAIVSVSNGPYPNSAAWQTAVNNAVTTAAGKAPSSPRCAVIDSNGNVVNVIMADPAIDSVPGMTLVLSDTASVGWTWTAGGGFVAPLPGPAGVHVG